MAASIRLAARARLAGCAQEAPAGEASLLDTVLEGDPERLALLAEAETRRPDAAGRNPRTAARHRRRRGAGARRHDPGRARLRRGGAGAAGRRFSGGWRMRVALATALFAAAGPAAAGRADQPSRPGSDAVAGGLARAIPRRRADRLARPRPARPRGARDRASGPRQDQPHARRLRRVRAHPHRARHAAGARGRARSPPQRAHIQSFVDRFRYKASKARQAQSRIKALARLPAIEAVIEDAPTRFAFPEPARDRAADPGAGARVGRL